MKSVLAQNVNPSGPLSENTYEAAQSSGSAVVGAQLVADQILEPNEDGSLRFAMHTPAGWNAGACVSVESANGLYDGKGLFTFDDGARNIDQYTTYPTKYSERVATLDLDELAVAIRQGACGRRPKNEGLTEQTPVRLALAFWRTFRRLTDEETVRIYLNPFDAQRAQMIVDGQSPIECSLLSVPVKIEYSMKCDILGSKLTNSPAILQIRSQSPGRGVESSWIELHFKGQ